MAEEKYEDNPKSIKYYVKQYILRNAGALKGKKVVDFPAGNGITSRILRENGAEPVALDLFPEYFNIEGLSCERANIMERLPNTDASADYFICQEGIEHFSDQFKAFKEFSRVLKKGGKLLVTTPNYSNLRSKLSYLYFESEHFRYYMPPNELDSIWMSDQKITKEIYFGHIFLIGIQKMRVLAKLNGLKIKKVHFTRLKGTNLLLFPLVYPWLWLSNFITYKRNLKKNKMWGDKIKKEVYKELFDLSVNPKILLDAHLMVEFEKEQNSEEVAQNLQSMHREFGTT